MKRGPVLLSIVIFSLLLCGAGGCKGKSFEYWQKQVVKLTGENSTESRTMAECAEGMKMKIEECSKHEGWMVDNQVSITDFKTNKNFELQDIRKGGKCSAGLKENDKRPFTADSKFLDTQSESKKASFQILCKIACYSWPCEETTAPNESTALNPPSEKGEKGEKGQCSGMSKENACGSCNSDSDCGGSRCYTSMLPAPFCK